jgi:hypothetical protein
MPGIGHGCPGDEDGVHGGQGGEHDRDDNRTEDNR